MARTFQQAGNFLIPLLSEPYLKTLKFKLVNPPDLSEPSIFVFWHGNMLAGWYLFRHKGFYALISKSKDGDILTRLLEKWKYNVVRGSSSKGGKEALAELKNGLVRGESCVMTPDGPRGPAKEFKNGALILSLETGAPIIPVKVTYASSKVLDKSWDKFAIPLPFSSCEIIYGEKFFYTEYLEAEKLGLFKGSLSRQM
jgi:lysophospholipid acyltransferase (LPLAT)-like uncharacterized protein